MTDTIRIQEYRVHTFEGEYPDVETYTHVNTELLYEGDDTPFHIVLPILEIGRVSANGLEYDESLVNAIEQQLANGKDGLGGHLRDDELDSAYPVAEVYWVGHQRVDNVTWAKGYIPPGQRREDIRRKKATNGGVGTSIFGVGTKEFVDRSRASFRLTNFKLEQLDLAPAHRAALKQDRGFAIVSEQAEEDRMEITRNDVPAEIVAEIAREAVENARLQADAGRVAELEQANEAAQQQIAELEQTRDTTHQRITELETEVAELRQSAGIVAELRTTLGDDADVVELVRQMHTNLTSMAETLGIKWADVSIRVTEMHEQIAELEKQHFDHLLDGKIAAFTAEWQVKGDAAKERLGRLQARFRKAIIAELGDDDTEARVAEIAQTLWDEEFQYTAKGMVMEMAGPPAYVGKAPQTPTTQLTSAEKSAEARARTGI